MDQVSPGFLLAIDKPSGISSHDVVNIARKSLGIKRIGHMGTLDPFASGVMVLGVGSAARLNQFLQFDDKSYLVTATFGASTNTFDCEGKITQTASIPDFISDKEFANKTINDLVGIHNQRPPAFSAIKVNGVRAYKAARAGVDIDIPIRKIRVYKSQLIKLDGNEWTFEVMVSKGTYIRSLVHDLGEALGCHAYASSLRRIQSGSVNICDCVSVDDLQTGLYKPVSLSSVLSFKIWNVSKSQASSVNNGNKLYAKDSMCENNSNVCIYFDKRLLAIYRQNKKIDDVFEYVPVVVFNGGVCDDN